MSRGLKNHKLGWIALAGLLLVAVLMFLPTVDRAVQAQTESNALRGWAWSDNIGWISFNSSNANSGGGTYNVSLTEDEKLIGYAWSSNIGYIRFDPSYTGVAGRGDNWGAKVDGNRLTGWARACAVFASDCAGTLRSSTENGGWDGWIKMTNVSITTQADNSRKLGGFAWGDLNLGWVSFAWTDFGGGGDPPIICEGPNCGVIIPPGGGNTVSCTVTGTEDPNRFQFTATGGDTDSVYEWLIDGIPVSGVSSNNFINVFAEVGSYLVSVIVDDGSEIACNGGEPIIIEQVPPDEETSCEISFLSARSMKYYKAESLNHAANLKAQINITTCGETGLNLQADNDIASGFQLVCSLTPAVSGFSSGLCGNLDGGQTYWIWVNPVSGTLPDTSIVQNLFELILSKPGDDGLEETDRERVRFDYSVSGST